MPAAAPLLLLAPLKAKEQLDQPDALASSDDSESLESDDSESEPSESIGCGCCCPWQLLFL